MLLAMHMEDLPRKWCVPLAGEYRRLVVPIDLDSVATPPTVHTRDISAAFTLLSIRAVSSLRKNIAMSAQRDTDAQLEEGACGEESGVEDGGSRFFAWVSFPLSSLSSFFFVLVLIPWPNRGRAEAISMNLI